MSEDQSDAVVAQQVAQRALAKCVYVERRLDALDADIGRCKDAVAELEGRIDD
ncbi:hypothetical protein SAMN05216388_101734 [Halorientalis persicus]|uniref:Uncharacterized protein n=1 Tax=Halorientalis persicus TaxID=1367881 RepID=A0A1H8RUP6_9EURY|nr:hypothetical protein [Halorientalis persicus]SEO69894.1 hypothetical protein SAMN05216388_101734 [Halorientalis persicus]